MGWKLVRDRNEEWCRARGVSGRWRTAPDPASALLRKIFEEAGEYAEHRDAAELYDLLDVLQALLALEDPGGEIAAAHRAKVEDLGAFGKFAEWTPIPAGAGEYGLSPPGTRKQAPRPQAGGPSSPSKREAY